MGPVCKIRGPQTLISFDPVFLVSTAKTFLGHSSVHKTSSVPVSAIRQIFITRAFQGISFPLDTPRVWGIYTKYDISWTTGQGYTPTRGRGSTTAAPCHQEQVWNLVTVRRSIVIVGRWILSFLCAHIVNRPKLFTLNNTLAVRPRPLSHLFN